MIKGWRIECRNNISQESWDKAYSEFERSIKKDKLNIKDAIMSGFTKINVNGDLINVLDLIWVI